MNKLQNMKIESKTSSFNIFDDDKILEKKLVKMRTDTIISPEKLKKFEKSEKLAILKVANNTKDKTNFTSTTIKPFRSLINCNKALILAITTLSYNSNSVNEDRIALLRKVRDI